MAISDQLTGLSSTVNLSPAAANCENDADRSQFDDEDNYREDETDPFFLLDRQPHKIRRIIAPIHCHATAVPDWRCCKYCLPTRTQRKEAKIPPTTQCSSAI